MKRVNDKSTFLKLNNLPWSQIPIQKGVNINVTLTCGQAFRWRVYEDDSFIGVFNHRLWQVKLCNQTLMYKVLGFPKILLSKGETDAKKLKLQQPNTFSNKNSYGVLLQSYFRLNEDYNKMKKDWTKNDKNIKEVIESLGNIVSLNQDPWENLITFLCTQNNNVSRIVKMVDAMCKEFGEKLAEIDLSKTELDSQDIVSFYDFPTIDRLQKDDVTDKLRKLGFGYRAAYVQKCAMQIAEKGGEKWLHKLRDQCSYNEAFEELQKLTGIGKKVADCICLMSLNKLEAVPIDTHVRKIAINNYSYKLPTKSLTDKTYVKLGDFFREKWGERAGWAQTVLFAKSLPQNIHLYKLQ